MTFDALPTRLSVCLLVVLSPLALAAPGDAWITAPADAEEGTFFTIDLFLDMGSSDYGAGQFRVSWDPALLELDTSHGIMGVGMGALSPTAVNANNPGEVIFNSVTVQTGLTGVLLLHTVGFEVVGAGGTNATIDLVTEALGDQSRNPFPLGSSFPRAGQGATLAITAPPSGGGGLCGDADGDGDVDILDALLTAQIALGIVVADAGQQLRLDVDSDGDLDILDALRIAKAVLGLQASGLTCPGGSTIPMVDPMLAVGDFDLVHETSAAAGGPLFVEVWVNTGTQALGAYDIELSYDPNVLNANFVVPAPGSTLGTPLAVNIDNPAGSIRFNDINVLDPGLVGVLHIATVQFSVIGSAGTTSPMDGFVHNVVDMQLNEIGLPAPRAMVSGTGQFTAQ